MGVGLERAALGKARRKMAVELYAAGKTTAEIAATLGLASRSSAHRVLRKAGVDVGYCRRELARRRRHNIRVYVRHGLSNREIAKRVGLSYDSVNRIRRELGIPMPRTTTKPRWVPGRDPRVGEMTRLYSQGWHDGRIARQLGVAHKTVWKWRQRLGIPPNKRVSSTPALDQVEVWLAEHGPASARQICAGMGLSQSVCWSRLAQLRRKGRARAEWVGGGPGAGKGERWKVWSLT